MTTRDRFTIQDPVCGLVASAATKLEAQRLAQQHQAQSDGSIPDCAWLGFMDQLVYREQQDEGYGLFPGFANGLVVFSVCHDQVLQSIVRDLTSQIRRFALITVQILKIDNVPGGQLHSIVEDFVNGRIFPRPLSREEVFEILGEDLPGFVARLGDKYPQEPFASVDTP